MSTASERDRDVDRKRAERQQARIVVIEEYTAEERATRAALEADDVAWLMFFFSAESGCEFPFSYEFTSQQRAMIEAIGNAIEIGGDQAIAASRGEGKTTLFQRLLIKYTLQGRIKFSVLFSATGSAAEDSLDTIKMEIETNDRLRQYYKEACAPVVALENTPNRAHYQKVSGVRFDNGKPYEAADSKFTWCGQEVVFPKVPGSPCSGAIIATRGLDSAVRGVNKKGRRVDVACIDDPDTEETARSEDQAEKLEDRIDRAIAGLGGQKRRVARVMLTTLQNRTCVSFRFTDPEQKPSWNGKRYRFLVSPPERMDLWEEYVIRRQNDWRDGTATAMEFYVANREAMEAGAVVANPNRYATGELSAIQHYFNQVASIGADAVATEYDNNPPSESGPVESGISMKRIQKQLSGFDRKIIPPGCNVLTMGIDVGKAKLHWVVRAWRSDATGFTIDYDHYQVVGTSKNSEDGLDMAITRNVVALIEEANAAGYCTTDGEVLPINKILVDAGWRTQAVYAACAQFGLQVQPIMGLGRSAGCVSANFHDQSRVTRDRKPGDGYFLSRKGAVWLVDADADRWKAWEHDRWMTAIEKPGSLSLYGQGDERSDHWSADEKHHNYYARQICNEVEIEEPYRGGMRRRWKAKSDYTHWFDASYYSDVAARIEGIVLVSSASAAPKNTGPRPTAKELQQRAKAS